MDPLGLFQADQSGLGWVTANAWKEYSQQGTLAGEKLAAGLVESAKLESGQRVCLVSNGQLILSL